ncbi:hypothetical protein F8172_14965 [Bacillus cereus]|uniref:Uncharacterized protein n=2 Tax=Bacillus TaxID=1386 RepID=A0A9W7QF05_BACCE|nr:hypothetical protein F8172_14965 [Bacillus cereus]KAB2407567.1 hypothetical protein F8170_10800 [Bacillus cereus]KAB2431529.1 hypothetical protein F8168_03790 [Bacillus cereus]
MIKILANIIFGFIIPWIFGIWLFKRNPKVILLIAPIGIAIAFLINEWGVNYFWEFKPIFKNISLSAYPLNLGLYPILVCFFIYIEMKKQFNTLGLICFFTLFLTVLEKIAHLLGKVNYINGWNIFWTFISYLVAILIVYSYFRILVRHQILNS